MAYDGILVGMPEIAQIAGVTRAAVGNWRKRHDDFPTPRIQRDAGVLFDLGELEEWLLANHKIDAPIAPGALLWHFADSVRGSWTSGTLTEFTISWLCYLELAERVASGRMPEVPATLTWTTVRDVDDEELWDALRAAGAAIESSCDAVHGLLSDLVPDPAPDPVALRRFAAELEAATDDITPRFALFEETIQRWVDLDAHAAGAYSTPGAVAHLMGHVAGRLPDGATVVDPACGSGLLLLTAAVGDAAPDVPGHFLGTDVNKEAVRRARARWFLYGHDVELRVEDSLRADPTTWPASDLVLIDPPLGLTNWGSADLYRDARWVYGSPPPSSADLAWLQLGLSMLRPTGLAVVALPAGSLFRAGREAEIRRHLIESDAVETVIELPARLRRNTSVSLAIWILRPPAREAADLDLPSRGAVLLVDATGIGTAGRSVHDIDSSDLEQLIDLVTHWRLSGDAKATGTTPAVAISNTELLAANGTLTPRRYLSARGGVDLAELDAEAERVRHVVRVHAAVASAAMTTLLERLEAE